MAQTRVQKETCSYMVNCSLFLFFFKKQRQFSGEWKVFYQFMLEQLEVYVQKYQL